MLAIAFIKVNIILCLQGCLLYSYALQATDVYVHLILGYVVRRLVINNNNNNV